MWSQSWTKGITEALEKTGEAIQQAEKQAAKGLTEAFEKTGEAITQAATKARPRPSQDATPGSTNDQPNQDAAANPSDSEQPTPRTNAGPASSLPVTMPKLNANGAKVLKNLQMSWSTVVETTKRTVEATKEVVETERSKLEQNFLRGGKGFYKRDPKLPLDVEALRDAQVVYITDRILTMSHPAMASSVNASITAQRKLAAVGHLLHRRHDGRYLVWNLSEVEYDTTVLDDQVMTFSFPGSPSPPLGLLLKMLISIENWMKADQRNVAVIHCLSGKGRTSTVLAAFLCWMGEAGFSDIYQALEYIAKCKQVSPQELTIPSQRRYASYFKNMLDGVRPSQPPLLLKRIIMSEAPRFAKGPAQGKVQVDNLQGGQESVSLDDESLMGCAPYLQIFKAGKLIFTTAATLHVQQGEEELPFVQVIDGTVPFNVEQVIQGDILIRCRHLTFSKQRVSMFRAAFHTGYVPPNVLRLTKSQLDGACSDKRYPDDFFVDLIFEKVDAETATKHLEEQELEEEEHRIEHADITKKQGPGKAGHGPVVTASSNDAMLQGNSRFWDVITNRRQEQNSQKADDPNWGPTVGRRRGTSSENTSDDKGAGNESAVKPPKSSLETFSIGNEFDFLPPEPSVNVPEKQAERDSLMEALHALDEDEIETEEVVFETPDTETSNNKLEASPFAQDTVTGAGPSEAMAGSAPASESGSVVSDSKAAQLTASSDDDVDDMDALLAAADENMADMNLEEFDDDDDLDDLEAMLKS